MPPERQPPQKRRRLPFKPPSRASPSASASAAGPSTSSSKAKPKTKPSKPTEPATTKEAPAASSSSSTSKPKSKRSQPAPPKEKKQSQKQKDKRPARTESPPPPSPSGSASGSESGSGTSGSGSVSSREPSPEPDYILAEITDAQHEADDVLSSEPAIPTKLLTRLLHQHFQNPKTKVAKEANPVIAKYVDVFVREALARAAYERAEGGGGDGFLEVEDLEKMAPQLTMDF